MKSAIELIGGLVILLFILALSICIGGTLIELIIYNQVIHTIVYTKMFYASLLLLFIGIAIFFFYNINYDDL